MKFKPINLSKIILLLGCALSVASCSEDPYLYDRTGFDASARPIVAPNPHAPNVASPDYYQPQSQPQQPQYYQAQPQYYQPQPAPNYAPRQAYQAAPAYAPQGYPPQYQGGGSRYYSNPYAMPPAPSYYQRYDEDQYYVPPSYYNNVEQPRGSGVSINDLNY